MLLISQQNHQYKNEQYLQADQKKWDLTSYEMDFSLGMWRKKKRKLENVHFWVDCFKKKEDQKLFTCYFPMNRYKFIAQNICNCYSPEQTKILTLYPVREPFSWLQCLC